MPACKSEVGRVESWWWRVLAACIPEEERQATKMEDGGSLRADRWEMWWEEALRGTQEYGLLVEFYEEQPSACRTVWHRQMLRAIYGSWRDQAPREALLPGQGRRC